MSLFDLPCIAVEEMTNHELRQFVPKLLQKVTGRSRPGYGKDSARPDWWPDDVPWSNPKSDTRCDKAKELSWTEALRRIVKSCYQHYGLRHLLNSEGASSSHTDISVTPCKETSVPTISDLHQPCYSDTPLSLEARVAPIPVWPNQPGAEHAVEPGHTKTVHCKRALIPSQPFCNIREDASHPILIDTDNDVLEKFMDVYICFFCEKEYHSCTQLQSHQQTCESRPKELDIICTRASVRKKAPVASPSNPKTAVHRQRSKESFVSSLGLVQGERSVVLRDTEGKREAVDCEILDIEEAPCLPPALTPNTPNTPKRLLSVLSPTANRKFEQVFAENNPSDVDSECSKSDIAEREPRIRHRGRASLLAIDLCSLLGQRIKKHVQVDNLTGTASKRRHHYDYEQFCHDPVKDEVRGRLRDRVEVYPITFKRRSKQRHEHLYKFTKAHKQEFMLLMKTGLSKKSRPLLKYIRKCSVRLRKISKSELKKWQKPVRYIVVDLEPLTEREIWKWTHHHHCMSATFPEGPLLLSKDIGQLLGLKKLPGSSTHEDIRSSLTLPQVVSEAVNAEVSQQTVTVYKSVLNEYAQNCKEREENARLSARSKNQSSNLANMPRPSLKDKESLVATIENVTGTKVETHKSEMTTNKDKPKDADEKVQAVKCAKSGPETSKVKSKTGLAHRRSRYCTRSGSQASSDYSHLDSKPGNRSSHSKLSTVQKPETRESSESLLDNNNKNNSYENLLQMKSGQREYKSQLALEETVNKSPFAAKIKIMLSPCHLDTKRSEKNTICSQNVVPDKHAQSPANKLRYGLRSQRQNSTQINSDNSFSGSEVLSHQSSSSSELILNQSSNSTKHVKNKNDHEQKGKTSTKQTADTKCENRPSNMDSHPSSKKDFAFKLNMKKAFQTSFAEKKLCKYNLSSLGSPTTPAKKDRDDRKISLKRSVTDPCTSDSTPPEKRMSLYRQENPNTSVSVAVEGLTNSSSILFKCRICSCQQVYHKGARDSIEQHISSKHKGDLLNIVKHVPQEEVCGIRVYEILSACSQKNTFNKNSKTYISSSLPAAIKKPVSMVKPSYRNLFDDEGDIFRSYLQTRRTSNPLQPHHMNLNPQAPDTAPLSVNANIEPAATERIGVMWDQSSWIDKLHAVSSSMKNTASPCPRVLSSND